MIISVELAQTIVNHLMDIVKRNVNIMDCNGVVIASGQPYRINTFHEGGKLAVDENRVVEIYPEDKINYVGALEGVMWPIILRGKVVGVVGVTGHPQDVQQIANLVRTVTELILEREMFLADYGVENRLKDQLISMFLSNDLEALQGDIVNLSQIVKFHLNIPRIAIVLKIESQKVDITNPLELKNLLSDRLRENVLKILSQATFFCDKDMLLFYQDNLCIFKSLENCNTEGKLSTYITNIGELLLSLQPKLQFKVGIGSQVKQDSDLAQSYQEALFALDFPSNSKLATINEFEILLDYLFNRKCKDFNDCLAFQELKRKFDIIQSRYDMYKTIDCLLRNNLNVSLTANKLFIHRNTLKSRLEKLKKIVGLEPCQFFHHAMLCKCLIKSIE